MHTVVRLTLIVALVATSSASAQLPDTAPRDANLRSIDAQSGTASDVYFTALGLTLTGVGLGAIGGAVMGASGGSVTLFGSTADGDRGAFTAGAVLAGIGGACGALAFLLMPIAFGYDLTSTVRRDNYRHRYPSEARLGPGPGDVGLGLAISF
jgi:hypothetical protein